MVHTSVVFSSYCSNLCSLFYSGSGNR